MIDIDPLFDWLVDGAPGATTSAEVLGKFCDDLERAGVPIHRVQAFVRTLHPHVMGRRFLWKPGQKVTVAEASYAILHAPEFLQSPINKVFETGHEIRLRGSFEGVPGLHELGSEGITDYLVVPLPFLNKTVHAISFATRERDGFSAEHLAAIAKVARPMARVAEILALTRTAANVLSTYVGRNAGEQILAGKIQRGDTQSIRAAIWFSDLRGFTQLSSTIEPAEVIRTLNDLFDCQVPAIEAHGGEVLKFIGDGLLAIFPLSERSPEQVCEGALAAAVDAFGALEKVNTSRQQRGQAAIRFGLALHLGEVAYGNIGGSARLDFTCIGAAVNLAARLEGLTGKLERRVVLSADFAAKVTAAKRSLGTFELKGVPQPAEVFAVEQPGLS